ncbi:MAG TPA: cyanophycinase [Pirellulales bacterium]|nr:cyanophycinase [Pirellulales bacterium]
MDAAGKGHRTGMRDCFRGAFRRTCFVFVVVGSSVAASAASQSSADDASPAEPGQSAAPTDQSPAPTQPPDATPSSADARPAAEIPAGGKPAGGKLVICGGGALPIQLRDRFIDLAGGAVARVVVITTASVYADTDKMESKLDFWREQNLASFKVLHTRSRRTADDPGFAAPLREATGVWFVGGNQNWLTETYLGTVTEREIHGVLARCGVVGGTSAGAAIMSPIMIRRDKPELQTGPGFGFLPGTVVDQHFLKRNRQSRLLKVLDSYPDLVGLGIDEGTGVVVEGTQLSVVGDSQVVVCSSATSQGSQSVQSLEPGTQADLNQLRTLIAQVSKPADPAVASETASSEPIRESPMPVSAVSARADRDASAIGE